MHNFFGTDMSQKSSAVKINSYRPCVLWFTGLSGAGKSTTAALLQTKLNELGCDTFLLDGDLMRQDLCKDLGYSEADRNENIRRIGELAKLKLQEGLIVICATISPFKKMRDQLRARFSPREFIEVFIDAPLALCELRDTKGLYRKARAGEIKHFTGIDSAYEVPINPELHLRTNEQSPETCTQKILNFLTIQGYLRH
jgi:adenylylsulfate kinase